MFVAGSLIDDDGRASIAADSEVTGRPVKGGEFESRPSQLAESGSAFGDDFRSGDHAALHAYFWPGKISISSAISRTTPSAAIVWPEHVLPQMVSPSSSPVISP